jgi:hypothetical protein
MMKRMIHALAAVCLLGCASSAWAVPMPPGSTAYFPTGTTGPVAPWGSLTFVTQMSSNYVADHGAFSGVLHTIVYREASGTLDFWYQVTGSTHPLDRISVDSYTGYSTNMYWVNDASILPPETLGNLGTVAYDKFTHLVPDVIGANFQGGLGAASSNWLVVQTDATSYSGATARLQDGDQATAATLAPAPLPSSLVLVGTGLFSLAGGFVRRLRKTFIL